MCGIVESQRQRWKNAAGLPLTFDERQIGRFRIYAAATPSSLGGFTASVSVKQRVAESEDDTFFADLTLGDGFRFGDAKAALRYAFDVGHRQIRRKEAVATLPN